MSAEQRARQTDADAMNQKVRCDTKRAPLNSQGAHIVTEVHACNLLSVSLQLLQPKAEEVEGTTKNSAKPANIKPADTRMGALIWQICM